MPKKGERGNAKNISIAEEYGGGRILNQIKVSNSGSAQKKGKERGGEDEGGPESGPNAGKREQDVVPIERRKRTKNSSKKGNERRGVAGSGFSAKVKRAN